MQIRRLEIENFRGITSLTWHPAAGVNVVLGSGDTGKSTLLDAIALVLSPQPMQAAVETDYAHLDTTVPFHIRAVIGCLSDELQGLVYPPPLWGWNSTNCELTTSPSEERGDEPVLHVEVIGTEDLELLHTILQPGNDPRPMSVAVRVAIGLWNISTTRAPDAQLRMSRGSLLERAVGRNQLRAPAVLAMQGTANSLDVPPETTAAINRVADQLHAAGLQFDDLKLSLVPGSGQSPVQLVTLVARLEGGQIPLANFGRGSQQVAMVTLAAAEIANAPIAVVDEFEAGLEPYRQRALLAKLRAMVIANGQAFLTSHSPAVLRGLETGEAWRLRRDPPHSIEPITGPLAALLKLDPEALLCRLPVIGEGATEVGVLHAFFADASESDVNALGIHIVDGGGHEGALRFVEAFANNDRPTFALVDDETFARGQRQRLTEQAHIRMCESPGGRCIECALANALPAGDLDEFIALSGVDRDHVDVNARRQAVTAQLGTQSRDSVEALLTTHPENAVRAAIGEAATAGGWFKSVAAGEELGRFMIAKVPVDHPLLAGVRALVADALTCVEGAAIVADG